MSAQANVGQLSSILQFTPPVREHWLGHWVIKPGQCKETPLNAEYWTWHGVVVIKPQTVVTWPVQNPQKTKGDKIPAWVGRRSGGPTPIWRWLATDGTVVTVKLLMVQWMAIPIHTQALLSGVKGLFQKEVSVGVGYVVCVYVWTVQKKLKGRGRGVFDENILYACLEFSKIKKIFK